MVSTQASLKVKMQDATVPPPNYGAITGQQGIDDMEDIPHDIPLATQVQVDQRAITALLLQHSSR